MPKPIRKIAQWVKNMDACGIEKTIILSGKTGVQLDSTIQRYAKFGKRFEVWCGFDYTGFDQPGYGPAAVKELERCYKMGARGVGELSDKGLGAHYSDLYKDKGMHFDDARMKPLYEKCAELHMPINVHLADPIWMYEKMDATNDGLMNAEIYGTDMGVDTDMYRITFRVLESNDEHFYETGLFHYHWAMNGFGLQKEVLSKLYNGNAAKILKN